MKTGLKYVKRNLIVLKKRLYYFNREAAYSLVQILPANFDLGLLQKKGKSQTARGRKRSLIPF